MNIPKFIREFVVLPQSVQVAIIDELQKLTYEQDVHVQETPQTGKDENGSEDFTGPVPSDFTGSGPKRNAYFEIAKDQVDFPDEPAPVIWDDPQWDEK